MLRDNLNPLLDISLRDADPNRAIAYLDGADARLYRALVVHLGSEEAAQNAVILVGLMEKLRKVGTSAASSEMAKLQRIFPKVVGVSYKHFDQILGQI